MWIIVFWLIMGVIVGMIAVSKGRSGFLWFLYGLLIWPIALVHALLVSKPVESDQVRAEREGRRACPHCAELIKGEAKVCPFCRRDVVLELSSPVPERKKWPE